MKNEVLASILAAVLFGFSALLMWINKEEPVHAILMIFSALCMLIHAYHVRNGKVKCQLKKQQHEN